MMRQSAFVRDCNRTITYFGSVLGTILAIGYVVCISGILLLFGLLVFITIPINYVYFCVYAYCDDNAIIPGKRLEEDER